MTQSELERVLRSLFEQGNRAWNKGNFERAYQFLGDDFEYELASTWQQARPLRGRAEVVEFFEDFRRRAEEQSAPSSSALPLCAIRRSRTALSIHKLGPA